jgi:rod shape-determining protein MreD
VTGPFPKTALVVLSALVLQASVAANVRPFGRTPELLVLLAVAGGMVGGAERGAIVGFFCGIAMDLVVQTPFGLWALTATLIGWATGHIHGRAVAGPIFRSATAVMATAAGLVGFVVLGALLGQEGLFDLPLVRIVVVVSLLNGLLAPFAVRSLRWSLAGSR